MAEQATVTGLGLSGGRVSVKIEISAEVNVSAFVARQRANRFLVMQVGDQFYAGEPELTVRPKLSWRLPVNYAPSRHGPLSIVGHLLVDVESGELTFADGQKAEDFLARAETLYERHGCTPL